VSGGLLPERADLLALDLDALSALANRGLVKRAAREVEREAPTLSAGVDAGASASASAGASASARPGAGGSARAGAVVVAEFADGVRTELPAGGLERGSCSCGATTVCRHVVGLVLAYQAAVASSADAPDAGASNADTPDVSDSVTGERHVGGDTGGDAGGDSLTSAGDVSPAGVVSPTGDVSPAAGRWSPGAFTDAELVARVGSRLVAVARRAERAGYSARVRRGTVPVVELPSATVRFLVPGDLGYVHTDARAGARDDVIALAVWAFRVADETHPGEAECLVDVGGAGSGEAGAGSGLEPVLEFAGEVLRLGAAHAGEGLAAAVAGHLGRLERAGLRWPFDATTELADQLAGYRERSARYTPETLADLIAELFARHRAVAHAAAPAAGLRARVLGTEESAETPLRRVRLDGLGARVRAVDDRRIVEVFHAQAATGVVLVSQREWTTEDDGPALGRRRAGGSTVSALAAGVVVTESAVRSASRAVRLATSRVARSTVTVGAAAWDRLPASLLTTEYPRLAAEIGALPPRPVRARVRADLVRVLAIAEVGDVHYAPGEQRLTVEIRDRDGHPATIVATHSGVAPGRIDAVLAALTGGHGTPKHVSGSVHRSGGGLVVRPYAIVADGPPIVPDLTDPDQNSGRIEPQASPGGDPLAAAIAQARTVLAEAAHHGLGHLPGAYPDRLREARQALARVGLHRIAGALDRLGAALGPDPGDAAVIAWVDAQMRVGMAGELR
jgi:hypothetical protein